MAQRVVLAGGSGFIGRALAKRFAAQGDEVIVLSRQDGAAVAGARCVHWDGETLGEWAGVLEGADLLVNLTGRSVDCRYNQRNKKAILDSRVGPTRLLGQAVGQCQKPPGSWFNLSTATLYRHAEDRPMDEETGEIGEGFSVNVGKAWEEAFFSAPAPKTQKAALRAAIVLGKEGGVFGPFKNLVLSGMGGIQGNGRQMFSFIHEEDLFGIVQFARTRGMTGVINCSAPHPLPNREVMSVFRRAYGVPFGLPLPSWLISVGAWLIRTEPELLLKSRWVAPGRLLKDGFTFKYPRLEAALATLV